MNHASLYAISPIDGRYAFKAEVLAGYTSEYALFKYRALVEIEYFIALCLIPLPQLLNVDKDKIESLRGLYLNFDEKSALRIKEIEKTTNHDVKALEYWLREAFAELGLGGYVEFIHFGLTSQDINNTAFPMMIRDALRNVLLPALKQVTNNLENKSRQWKDVPMLARTHGQPASPTRLGKEIRVFLERIAAQVTLLEQVPHTAKFGGATGNFNAHHVAYPNINWPDFAEGFLKEQLGLHRSRTTTQIEHYDHLAALCDNFKRINTILLDLCRDMWSYISMEYFKQQIRAGEVGSSAMPHKVNPIDFENAEGNLGYANALFEFFAAKLPVSRLQRDLTDSTVMRNIGVPLAHTLIAWQSVLRGLEKLLLNEEKLAADLSHNYTVIAEAIQTILRREGYPNPYQALKELTRTHVAPGADEFAAFIDGLAIDPSVKEELKKITPENYTGIVE
jgi:adenylosuccinate lyase